MFGALNRHTKTREKEVENENQCSLCVQLAKLAPIIQENKERKKRT